MKFLKPSDLPVDTIIEFDDEQYLKVDYAGDTTGRGLFWQPIHCEDCCATRAVSEEFADQMMKAYRIVSLPYKLVADLVESLTTGSGVPTDVTIAFMLKNYNAQA